MTNASAAETRLERKRRPENGQGKRGEKEAEKKGERKKEEFQILPSYVLNSRVVRLNLPAARARYFRKAAKTFADGSGLIIINGDVHVGGACIKG